MKQPPKELWKIAARNIGLKVMVPLRSISSLNLLKKDSVRNASVKLGIRQTLRLPRVSPC